MTSEKKQSKWKIREIGRNRYDKPVFTIDDENDNAIGEMYLMEKIASKIVNAVNNCQIKEGK